MLLFWNGGRLIARWNRNSTSSIAILAVLRWTPLSPDPSSLFPSRSKSLPNEEPVEPNRGTWSKNSLAKLSV